VSLLDLIPDPFRIIAHRGASGYAPENTMTAFRRAVDMGVDEIETDVHFTQDGELVLLHDHSLDRTTDGSGAPQQYSLAQLRRLDAGSWMGAEFAGERLLSLGELFAAFEDRLTYHVELKDRSAGIGAATAAIVRRYGRERETLVSGFDCDAELLAAKAAAPGVRSTVLVSPKLDPGQSISRAVRDGHDGVSLHVEIIDPDLVATAQAAGLELRCWGIRNRQDMERGAVTGCNGMTINWPDWLQQWVAESS
jgi:glycerophosphoryl diester phosphodiesterase